MDNPVGIRHDAYALSTQSVNVNSMTPRHAALFLLHLDDITDGVCPNCADLRAYYTPQQLRRAAEEARRIAASHA